MRWILIGRHHINTHLVRSVHWLSGRLVVRFSGDDVLMFPDPDRDKYLRVCRQLGVLPVEVEPDGEK